MDGWRTVDQEPVASRQALGAGFEVVLALVEQAAVDGARPVVLACWQDAAYLPVPPGVVERLAAASRLTVACAGRPVLPADVWHVPLEADHPEMQEWSVVVLAPGAAVALVAREVDATLPAGTVEGGRAYRYDATDATPVVVAHARRLTRSLGARLAPDAAAVLAEAITALAALPTAETTGALLPAAVAAAVDRADEHRRDAVLHPDEPGGGLASLAGWLQDAGPLAPALGMVVVRADVRGVTAVLRERARAVGRLGDLVVDVPPDAAMIVLPGLRGRALNERATEVAALLREALATEDVRTTAVEVPAERARRDLVGSLGTALARLRDVPAGGGRSR